MKKLVVLAIIMLTLAMSSQADVINDPPVVEILNFEGVAVDTLSVDQGEAFTLIGNVSGDQPFTYSWSQDGTNIGENDFLLVGHTIADPRMHVITLVAIDVNDLAGADSCYVDVASAPVPTQAVSWGAIKRLY